jgi:hypothetical protein
VSTTYSEIVRQCALRINAITSTTASTIQSTYVTTPFTSAQVGSSIFNFTAMKDAILNIEGRLADAIASTGDHPYRAYLISTTAALTNGEELPSLDSGGEQIIGQWGAVFDATDTTQVYRPKDIAQVMRRTANPGSRYRVTVYWYFMDDLNIYHTGTSVKVKVCVYSRSNQSTAFDADDPMLLPDSLADALVCGTISELVRDDEFMAQAGMYRQYYNEVDQSIRNGLKSIPAKAETGPLLAATSF